MLGSQVITWQEACPFQVASIDQKKRVTWLQLNQVCFLSLLPSLEIGLSIFFSSEADVKEVVRLLSVIM